VHLTHAGEDTLSITVTDEHGQPVASAGSLATRNATAAEIGEGIGGREGLLGVDWVAVSVDRARTDVPDCSRWAIVGEDRGLEWALGDRASSLGVYADVRSLGEAVGSSEAPDVVLLDCSAPGGGLPGAAHAAILGVLGVVQGWLDDERFGGSRLVVLTRGAVGVGGSGGALDLAGAAVWGLVRSAQSESPSRFVLVDIDGQQGSRDALFQALEEGEPQVAIRDGELFVPRLVRTGLDDVMDVTTKGFGRGTVLVTGGTGGLGALLAKHLVIEHGVRSLLLVSRAGERASRAAELERELTGLGASVWIAGCDVSDREQLEALIASVDEEHPLCGVIHAAGVLDDGVIGSLTPERMERVLAPKVDGAWHLHELTMHMDLDAFVLFSSVSATLGAPGQGNYAAANAFLDGLAEHRRAHGLPGLSIAWGPWGQTAGMTSRLGRAEMARMASSGMLTLSDEQGLGLFDAAGAAERSLAVLARFDTVALRARARDNELPSVLERLVRMPVRQDRAVHGISGSLAERLASTPETERERVMLDLVRAHIAAIVGHSSPDAIGPTRAFKELGFDSLAAVELRNKLTAATGVRLPATLVFDYPTPAALARSLLAEMALEQASDRSLEPELDRFEQTLAAMPVDDSKRMLAVTRLQTLLRRLNNGDSTRSGVVSTEEELQSASASEIYDFIDKQLGSA
jgi:NADP-dependent 3-hydroxy acid dehydrogenase YdfG/acyl carrier protein